MSELINNSAERKAELKQLILKLHKGVNPDTIKNELEYSLKQVPYGEVVEVEQELVEEGMPIEEIQKLCDIHSFVMKGNIDLSGLKIVPKGHPVDTFKQENKELLQIIKETRNTFIEMSNSDYDLGATINKLKNNFNLLYDVDKHYKRKENLLFPYLEKLGITAPPKVMWGKHDEIREQIKAVHSVLNQVDSHNDLNALIPLLLEPALFGIEDMTVKEETILFPMSLDRLTEYDWWEIYEQTGEYGYCLYDAKTEWKPNIEIKQSNATGGDDGYIQMPSGRFTQTELLGILNTLPFDITFVDKDDKVKYFSEGSERVFERSRAVLLRDVRLCHPPSSVHIVDQIIDDFRSGKQNRAAFWINMRGQFVHIEYYAVRGEKGDYLGTLEVTQEISKLRALEGEQRLLNYDSEAKNG